MCFGVLHTFREDVGLGGCWWFLTGGMEDRVIFDVINHLGRPLWRYPESFMKIRINLGAFSIFAHFWGGGGGPIVAIGTEPKFVPGRVGVGVGGWVGFSLSLRNGQSHSKICPVHFPIFALQCMYYSTVYTKYEQTQCVDMYCVQMVSAGEYDLVRSWFQSADQKISQFTCEQSFVTIGWDKFKSLTI